MTTLHPGEPLGSHFRRSVREQAPFVKQLWQTISRRGYVCQSEISALLACYNELLLAYQAEKKALPFKELGAFMEAMAQRTHLINRASQNRFEQPQAFNSLRKG